MTILCDYCSQPARLVHGGVIYPHINLFYEKGKPVPVSSRFFWQCVPCRAYVGTHKDSPTNQPLGRLANAELRNAKKAAHAIFDPLWKEKTMSRSKAYAWLARALEIDPKDCHIGMFDLDLCRKTIDAVTITMNNPISGEPNGR